MLQKDGNSHQNPADDSKPTGHGVSMCCYNFQPCIQGAIFWPFGVFFGFRSKKILEPTNVDYQFLLWKCSCIFCFLFCQIWDLFCIFWALWAIFGLGSGSKTFLGPTYSENQLWFWKYSPNFCFYLAIFGASFTPFWALWGYFFGPLGVFLESESGSPTFLESTYVVYVVNQLWFWKYSSIILSDS